MAMRDLVSAVLGGVSVVAFAMALTTPPSAAQGVIGTIQGTIEGDPSLDPGLNGGLAPGQGQRQGQERARTADDLGAIDVAPLDPLDTGTLTAPIESLPGVRVTLRGLDKMTGDVETLEAAVGEEISFHRLRIAVEACFSRVGESTPDSSVFLRIVDSKAEAVQAQLAAEGAEADAVAEPDVSAGAPPTAFSGWMFASSPALSAMDHPRYDVWVLSCAIS